MKKLTKVYNPKIISEYIQTVPEILETYFDELLISEPHLSCREMSKSTTNYLWKTLDKDDFPPFSWYYRELERCFKIERQNLLLLEKENFQYFLLSKVYSYILDDLVQRRQELVAQEEIYDSEFFPDRLFIDNPDE